MIYKIINWKKLYLTMLADMIGSVIFLPKLLRSAPPIDASSVKSILVIRTAYIGDVVMTLPILRPLKERFPDAKITFLTSTTCKPVLENNPYVDEIVTFNPPWFYPSDKSGYFPFIKSIRKRSFDLVIEARGDIRELLFIVAPLRSRYKVSSGTGGGRYLLTHVVPYREATHRVEYHLDMVRFLGCRTEQLDWGIHLSKAEEKRVDDILINYGIKSPFITAHPASRLPLKMWPIEKCAALYDMIMAEFDVPLLILGAKNDGVMARDITRQMKRKPIDLSGRLNLREFAGVVSKSLLFICNDSAPMHIAAAMKTPTVAIFGPSKSRETGPFGKTRHCIVEKEFSCRFTCDENTCKYKFHNACMHTVTPDDVFREVKDVMAGLRK